MNQLEDVLSWLHDKSLGNSLMLTFHESWLPSQNKLFKITKIESFSFLAQNNIVFLPFLITTISRHSTFYFYQSGSHFWPHAHWARLCSRASGNMLSGRCNHLHFYTSEHGWEGVPSINLLDPWPRGVVWQEVTALLKTGHLALYNFVRRFWYANFDLRI